MRGSSQKDNSAGTQAIVRSPDVAGRVICAVAAAMLSKAAETVGSSSAPCADSLTPLAAALEQRDAEIVLQRPDLVADRAMRHVEFARRRRHRAVAGRSLEGAQRIERRKAGRQAKSPL